MRWPMPHPCMGARARAFRARRSTVPRRASTWVFWGGTAVFSWILEERAMRFSRNQEGKGRSRRDAQRLRPREGSVRLIHHEIGDVLLQFLLLLIALRRQV